MTRRISLTSILFAALMFSAQVLAQWPYYLPPGTPLLPDGTPDLDAPAPRTVDGKPDFSGTWNFIRHNQGGEQGRPIGEPEVPPPGVPPYATFWDQGFVPTQLHQTLVGYLKLEVNFISIRLKRPPGPSL